MNRFTLLIAVLLFNLSLFAQPKITSFAPASGPIGTVVKITGTNFNTTTDKNIVFFGAVKATVSAASATSLTVTVPIGTTYYPITVTTLNNNLTAYSSQPFLVTFSGAGPVFDANSFKTHVDFTTGIDPYGVFNIDLDGDGKPDVANSNYSSNSISVLKNTSSINSVSYITHIDYPTGLLSGDIYSGDLDGDGKPDLVATNWISNNLSVFRNTSVSGTVSFAAKSDLIAGTAPTSVSIGDIDGDGKPDLVITNGNSFDITIRRNTSSIGNISFANGDYFPTGTYPNSVVIRDFDGDGKPDLGISLGSANKMEIYRNTSTPGIISLVDRKDYAAGNGPFWIAAGDLDGDGKPDLAVPNNQSTTLSIYRNTSTPGVISFATKVDLYVGLHPQRVAIGDLDGDGKPDLAVANNANFGAILTVFKNTCSVGSISFASKFDYTFNWGPLDVEIGDVDGDKLPDIIVSTYNSNIISILLNNTVCTAAAVNTQPADSSICAGSNSSFLVNSTNAKSYQWQENAGSGWNNLLNNAMYSGCLTDKLSITGATVIMNNYQYRCILSNECGNTNSNSAKLLVISSGIPKITISTTTDTICNGANITFTASPINGGSAPNFQWKKNTLNVGTNSNTYMDNSFINGDIISCELISNSACVTTNTAMSNNIILTVTFSQTPLISIIASANNVCFGTPITFTATPVYGGTAPSFQWKKNGINTGSNASVYTDNALNNGDIITCVLRSNYNCITSDSVASNQLEMNINPLITPSIVISESANNICPGTLVIFSSTITNGGTTPIYQWKKNGIIVGLNSISYSDNAIANGDIITCELISNENCLSAPSVTSNTILMKLTPGVPVNLGPDTSICNGGTLVINAPVGYASYTWQDGSTNSSYSATKPGNYMVTVSNACGVISSDEMMLFLKPGPTHFLPADTAVCANQTIILKPNQIFISYLWNTNAVTPSLNISSPGLYWLEVTDINACKGRDSIFVKSKDCLKGLFMPNAFTPNNDGRNDLFKPSLFGVVKQYDFAVYNRYGKIVFETKDLSKGWDGTIQGMPQNPGVFIWKCVYQMENQLLTTESGTVLLIR